MSSDAKKIRVTFNQQQLQLLDNLKNEGKFGTDYAEIIKGVFKEYAKQKRQG